MKFLYFLLFLSLSNIVNALEKADLVLVNKSSRQMMLYKDGEVLQSYRISLGGDPIGHKVKEGDGKTPEGKYTLDFKKSDSSFYKAIRVSYPNIADRDNARNLGVDPGGQIMIHGQRNGFGWLSSIVQFFNWTEGCIAVTNSEMEEIWSMVDVGTPIEINP